MARKVALTPASIDALQTGLLADLLTPGLAIEVLTSGKKRWRYRRQVAGSTVTASIYGSVFPAVPIAGAREWARELNAHVEAGVDPREALRAEKARAEMTVARAHGLYMIAVREGRSSRARRPNKPRTVSDKLKIYERDIAPKLASSRQLRAPIPFAQPRSGLSRKPPSVHLLCCGLQVGRDWDFAVQPLCAVFLKDENMGRA